MLCNFNGAPAIQLIISLHTSAGMDWPYGGSFGQNELYGEFGGLREEEVEELRSERTIKSGLKVRFMLCC